MSERCARCAKPVGKPGRAPKDRAAIISLRLLYGDDGDGVVEDCAILCANCGGDAWEALLAILKEERAQGVEIKIK